MFSSYFAVMVWFGSSLAAPALNPSSLADLTIDEDSLLEPRWERKGAAKPTTSPWGAVVAVGAGPRIPAATATPNPLPAAPLSSWAAAIPAAPNPQSASGGFSPAIALPVAPAPANPAAPLSSSAKKSSLSLTTAQGASYCRKYPDNISTDSSGLRILGQNSHVSVTCWTPSTISGTDPIWLKAESGCYINQKSFSGKVDVQGQLSQCGGGVGGSAGIRHWVGTLQEQYKRSDCYDCTSLDCESRNMGLGPYVDVDCSIEGIQVAGNTTWYRQADADCFYPGGVFTPTGWLGTRGDACK
ncbi:hypothetical protein EJ08DRAFT_730868 [Tothia fuscella]|uniref:Uncharacterized protein n=1 Tax=Tothia fuscella TaxID=1048955 RepID=A0A9P4U106_9PEZI|nr:hypothetical protein EJ08DRAFT_730868 [Tothia fuscella]